MERSAACRAAVLRPATVVILAVFGTRLAVAEAKDRQVHFPEKLIGWQGEVHSVDDSISLPVREDRRRGCSTVTAGSDGLSSMQQPTPQWLYAYPAEGAGPAYTHMAMLTQLPNGTLIAAWQASSGSEGSRDQHFVLSTSLDDQGHQWAAPQSFPGVGTGKHPVWGPTFLVDTQRGALWLFYSENSGSCRGGPMDWAPGGDIKGVRYNLHTQEWGTPQLLLSVNEGGGIPKVSANKAIELSTGEFVLPFWRENALIGKSKACKQLTGKTSAGVLVSEDRGATWKAYGQLTTKGSWLIENALVELSDRRLMMVFRTRTQKIHVAYSADRGHSWSPSSPLASFKNPNSKVDLLRMHPGGQLVLAYNDHIAPNKDEALAASGCTKCRTNLKVAISHDEGLTWRDIALLEDELAPTLRIHYPTLQQVGCNVLVVYSQFHKVIERTDPAFSRQGVKLAHVSLGGDALQAA